MCVCVCVCVCASDKLLSRVVSWRVSSCLRGGNDPGSPFQLVMVDPAAGGGSRLFPADNSPLRIPLGRPAVVGVDRGRGSLQGLTPACEVICKSLTLFGRFYAEVSRQLLLPVTFGALTMMFSRQEEYPVYKNLASTSFLRETYVRKPGVISSR